MTEDQHLLWLGDMICCPATVLPNGYTHLMIAQELDQVGRVGEALEWAERGPREATGSVDARLVGTVTSGWAQHHNLPPTLRRFAPIRNANATS